MLYEVITNAKGLMLLNTIVLQNMGAALAPENLQRPQPYDENFQIVGNLLDVCDESVFERQPGLIFDAFRIMQENSELQGMTAPTLRASYNFV